MRAESSPPHDEHHMMDVEEPCEGLATNANASPRIQWSGFASNSKGLGLFWSWPADFVSTLKASASARTQRDWLFFVSEGYGCDLMIRLIPFVHLPFYKMEPGVEDLCI